MRAPAGRTARAHLSLLSLMSLCVGSHLSLVCRTMYCDVKPYTTHQHSYQQPSNTTRTAEHEHHARALDRRRVLKANYQL